MINALILTDIPLQRWLISKVIRIEKETIKRCLSYK